MSNVQARSKEIQEDVISFFKQESNQEKTSNWVYLFQILRYIFTPSNVRKIFLMGVVALAIMLVYNIVGYTARSVSASNAKDLIVEKETQSKIFASLIPYADKYETILSQTEKEINDAFKQSKNAVITSNKHEWLESVLTYHKQNVEQLSEDKRSIMMAINAAKNENLAMYKLDISDIRNALRRLQLHESKNYHSVVPQYTQLVSITNKLNAK